MKALYIPFKVQPTLDGGPIKHYWELTCPDLELLHRRLLIKFGERIPELFDGILELACTDNDIVHPLPSYMPFPVSVEIDSP